MIIDRRTVAIAEQMITDRRTVAIVEQMITGMRATTEECMRKGLATQLLVSNVALID
jgi:hypothetical protein